MKKMHVEGIAVDMDGIAYEFAVSDNEEYPEILPNHVTDIGKLYFNPKEICKNNCYTSFDLLSKPFGVKWMSTVNNYSLWKALDNEKLVSQMKYFLEMSQTLQSISFRLATSQIRRHEFNATVNFIWPKLVSSNVEFPFVQVNKMETKYIEIYNPSNQLLFVHFVLHDPKLHGNEISVTPEVLRDCTNCILSQENVFSFHTNNSDIYVNDIKPNSHLKIGINFFATDPGTYSTILYMRNNLTVVEAVWVTARSVVPQFKFGNRRPGSQTSLMFEIGEKHLKLCDKTQIGSNVLITSKRSFTAKNHGEVPISIHAINIEESPCEGYGFKVLNCAPLQLQPNESRKIEIAFSPDFTLARVVRQLNFITSIGTPVNFTLLATVPQHALELCSKNIQRPSWEADFKSKAVLVLTVALIFVVMTAYFDADRVLKEHKKHIVRDKSTALPPLDLRKIGMEANCGANGGINDNSLSNSVTKVIHNSSPNLSLNHPRKRNLGLNNSNSSGSCSSNNSSAASTSPVSGSANNQKKVANGGIGIKKTLSDLRNRLYGTTPKPVVTTNIVTETVTKATLRNGGIKTPPQQEKKHQSAETSGKHQNNNNNNNTSNKNSDEDSASNSSKENDSSNSSNSSKTQQQQKLNNSSDNLSPLTSNNYNKAKSNNTTNGRKSKNQLNFVEQQLAQKQGTPPTSSVPSAGNKTPIGEKSTNDKNEKNNKNKEQQQQKIAKSNTAKIPNGDVKNHSPTLTGEVNVFGNFGETSPTAMDKVSLF